jgi:hypothetical protein
MARRARRVCVWSRNGARLEGRCVCPLAPDTRHTPHDTRDASRGTGDVLWLRSFASGAAVARVCRKTPAGRWRERDEPRSDPLFAAVVSHCDGGGLYAACVSPRASRHQSARAEHPTLLHHLVCPLSQKHATLVELPATGAPPDPRPPSSLAPRQQQQQQCGSPSRPRLSHAPWRT